MLQSNFPFCFSDKVREIPEGLEPDLDEIVSTGVVPDSAVELPHNSLELEDIGSRCEDSFDALELRKFIGSQPPVDDGVAD